MVMVSNAQDESGGLIYALFESEDSFGVMSVCLYAEARYPDACCYRDALCSTNKELDVWRVRICAPHPTGWRDSKSSDFCGEQLRQ